jgi:tetratricopeptide (TPR) repeat protein
VAAGVIERAEALHARGVAEQNVGRPATALRLFERAQREVDAAEPSIERDRLAAAIWISLALNQVELRGTDAGLAALGEARARAARIGDPALLVRIQSQHAIVAIRSGQYDAALAALKMADELLDNANDNDRYAVLLNTGLVCLLRHDLPAARRALTRAVDFARAVQMRVGVYKALHNLAYLEFLAGDLPLALRGMSEVLQLGDDLPRGIPLLDRARVLAEAGLVQEADSALAEAATIFRRDRLSQDLGEVELERARCALIIGDVAGARRLAGRARDRFRRRGNDRWRRAAELVLLQGDLAANRPGKRLVGPATRLKDELETDGLRLPARTAALIAAEAHLSAGQVADAAAVVDGIGAVAKHDPITSRLHARYVQARLDVARGRSASAARRTRIGLDELARYQASFGSIDLSTAAAVHGQQLAELQVAIAMEGRRAPAIFAAVETARAVSTRLAAVRPPADAPTAELLAELRQVVEALRAVEHDRAAAEPLLRQRSELERQVASRGWTREGGGPLTDAASVDNVSAALTTGDSAMAMYFPSAGRMHALVIDGARIEVVDLVGAAAITERVRRVRADLDVLAQAHLPGGLAGAVRASFDRSVAALDAELLAPIAVGRRLVIVSTGVLGQLPWGALPSLRGVPVVVAPSATSWLRATAGRTRRRRVIACAGPDLVRAEHEVTQVGQAWDGSQVLTGEDAGGRSVASALASASVVHIAAHGVHQTENPLFSSLRLTDGPFFAHELDQSARMPEHVILSACELGLTTVRPGDEALGLTSVLLHLGTRSVVAGVARVGDDVAADTMIEYHRRLASGLDSAAALAEATEGSREPIPFVTFGAARRA